MPNNSQSTNDKQIPIIGLRREDAARALGIKPRKLSEIMADRSSGIPYAKLGAAVVFPVRELEDWLAEQTRKNGVRK